MGKIIFDEVAEKVLNGDQQKLLPLLEDFSSTHFLGGVTAIALYLGHRESIDFDFFSKGNQGTFANFVQGIGKYGCEVSQDDRKDFAGVEFEEQDEIHVTIQDVKVSCINFFRTLYSDQKINIEGKEIILGGLKVASLEELAVMKLFAMISRKKWKDAVDLYFLMNKLTQNLAELLELAEKKYFVNIFNKDAVLEQLIFKDWDTTESVLYLIETPPEDKEIEDSLEQEALNIIQE